MIKNKVLKLSRLAVFASVVAGSAAAANAGLLYDCNITDRNKNVGWLSPKVVVVLPDGARPQVYDNVVLNFYGKPIPAKVTRQSDTLIVRWNLKRAKDSEGQMVGDFAYTARINTKSNKVHLEDNPTQFPNRWTGRGSCKTRKG